MRIKRKQDSPKKVEAAIRQLKQAHDRGQKLLDRLGESKYGDYAIHTAAEKRDGGDAGRHGAGADGRQCSQPKGG